MVALSVLGTYLLGLALDHFNFAAGAYTGEFRSEIIVIVTKQGYLKPVNYISAADPSAFVTVCNVNKVICHPKKLSRHGYAA